MLNDVQVEKAQGEDDKALEFENTITFPTAKGIRRLFREIITRISKKPIR